MNGTVVIKRKIAKPVMMFFGSLGFTALSVFLWSSNRGLAIMGILFFGVGGIVATGIMGRRVLRGEHDITLDAYGITDHYLGVKRQIAWQEIASINIVEREYVYYVKHRRRRQKFEFIQLNMRNDNFIDSMGAVRSAGVELGRAYGYDGLFIDTATLKMPAEQALALMQQYHQAATRVGDSSFEANEHPVS